MPLNFPDLSGYYNARVNPFGNPIDMYKTQQESVAAKYADRKTQAEVLGKELENVFNEIRNRTAHEKNVTDIGHTRAQTGYLNEQAKWHGPLSKSSIAAQAPTTAFNEAMLPIYLDIIKQLQQAQTNAPSPQNGNLPGMYSASPQTASGQSASYLDNLMSNPFMAGILKSKFGIEPPKVGDFEGYINDVNRVRQKYGENSPEYGLAKNWLQRKSEGAPGMQLSVGPNGEITLTQGNAPKGVGPQMIGDTLVTPESQAAINARQSRGTANISRDYLANAAEQPYVGEGATNKLISDWNYVKSSPNISPDDPAAKRLIDAAVAQKLIAERAMEQIKSQGIEGTRFNLKAQEDALTLGWPNTAIKLITDNLPANLQKEANRRHDEILKESNRLKDEYGIKGFPTQVTNLPPSTNAPKKEAVEENKIVNNALNVLNILNPENPYTEKELEEEAKKYGMTKAQFANYIIEELRKKK